MSKGDFMEVKINTAGEAVVAESNLTSSFVGVHQPFNVEFQTDNGTFTNHEPQVVTRNLNSLQGDILSTMRTRTGDSVTDVTKISDDYIVKAGGVEMTVAQAKTFGFISGNNQSLAESSKTGQVSSHDEKKDAEIESVPAVDFTGDDETFATIQEVVGGVDNFDVVQHGIVGALTATDINGYPLAEDKAFENAVGVFMQNIPQVNPETAKESVGHIMGVYKANAAKYITDKHGMDGNKVIQWAADNLRPSQKAAIYNGIIIGNFHVLDMLANNAVRNGVK